MTTQHGPRAITAPDMEQLLDLAQQIADGYTPGRRGLTKTRVDEWGTHTVNGVRNVWARITIIVED